MSIYLYLLCLDHDPPLIAEDESGQHIYNLPDIRADIANRDWLVTQDPGEHYRRNSAAFLVAHPKCRIGIRDEYGDDHPTTATTEETTDATT